MAEPAPDAVTEDEPARVLASTEFGLVLSEAGFGDVHVLSHEAADRALTENRRTLITVIASEDVASISELARRVGRDKANVKRDLDVLAEENIVAFESTGRERRPTLKPDTIVQEPIVVHRFDEP